MDSEDAVKLSASYSYFNGYEHLLASIRSIRAHVEHVSIVWQKLSNAGEPIAEPSLDALADAVSERLVDELVLFEPDMSKRRRENELSKRRIGLELARKARCTHFFTIDADEFYRADELAKARSAIKDEGLTSTSVSTFMHIKRPVYRAPDTTNCAFITKINLSTRLGSKRYPIANVDSTRRIFVFPRRHRHFSHDEIAMYHMNLVRSDISEKLRNSSTTDQAFLEDVVQSWRSWEPGLVFDFGTKGSFQSAEVRNEFYTFDPGP